MSNPIPEKYPYLAHLFVEFLMNRSDFLTIFQAWAPEIYADIASAKDNPNCTCRQKVEQYITSHSESLIPLINTYIIENNVDFNFEEFTANMLAAETMDYYGTVDVVKISDWKNYIHDLYFNKRARFRSFSVIKLDEETIQVFFV